MRIRSFLIALLLVITASADAKIGDVITLDSLTIGTDHITPENCDNWVVYKWEGIMRFTVTSESPKECVVYGKWVDGTYLPAITDPEGKLVKNNACHLIIPQEVAGYKVVGVDDGAFYKSNYLSSVHLPEGLRRIGKDCFYECKFLSTVSLPSTIVSIGDNAFGNNTQLEDVYIHSTQVPTVGENSFGGNYEKLHVLYVSQYNQEPWVGWFPRGIVSADMTVGDVMIDLNEAKNHELLEQRMVMKYPELEAGFKNGTSFMEALPFGVSGVDLTIRNVTLNCGAIGEEVAPIRSNVFSSIHLLGDNHFMGSVTAGMSLADFTTIEISGTTRIDTSGGCYSLDGIYCVGGLTLNGGGHLIIDVDCDGLSLRNFLWVFDTKLTVQSSERSGIDGYNSNILLLGYDTDVRVKSYKACVSGINSMSMNSGLEIVSPEGAALVDNAIRYPNGDVVSNEWVEIYSTSEVYPLYVCGLKVTEVNCTDLLAELSGNSDYSVSAGSDAALYYDNGTKTLTMRNVQITMPDDVEVVRNGKDDAFVEGLKVNVEGNCTFSGNAGFYECNGGILFTGDGTLTVNAGDGCGLRIFTRAEVNGPTLVVHSTDNGVFADNMTEDATLAVTSGTMKVAGGIRCFRLELAEEMDILSPNHAHFGLSDNGVNYGVVNGDNAFVTNEIVIGERNSYYVFIGGVELTKQLCEDQDALIELLIESDEQLMEDFFEGISEIYYIPETKTLHMKNFRMNFADNEGIKNGGFIRGANRHGVLDLNIEIEGDCSLTSHGTVPLYVFNGPTTLTGNGTLSIHSDNNMGVCCYDDFTLYGPTLVTDGTMGFYSYDNEKSPTAKIFMGTLRAKGSEKSFYAQHLNLSSAVKITDPVGAYWDETSFNVVNAGGSIVKNEWVVFESSTATGILDEGVRKKNDGWNATDVYDLQGRRISTSTQALKHGIYVVNGQKVVVR